MLKIGDQVVVFKDEPNRCVYGKITGAGVGAFYGWANDLDSSLNDTDIYYDILPNKDETPFHVNEKYVDLILH